MPAAALYRRDEMGERELRLERERRLRGQPYREGHYWLGQRGEQFVKVSATLYPKIVWWIEDCAPPQSGADTIQGTRRPLTPEDARRLEDFL
jgi:hypothetical protein